jgi:thiamine-monophosphate kinase
LREKKLATAMIDTSDGLSTDLAHICEESRVGAQIDADALPKASLRDPRDRKIFHSVDLKFALHGGEDYELIFTAPASMSIPMEIAGVSVSEIGRIIRGRHIMLKTREGARRLAPQGWEHFRSE